MSAPTRVVLRLRWLPVALAISVAVTVPADAPAQQKDDARRAEEAARQRAQAEAERRAEAARAAEETARQRALVDAQRAERAVAEVRMLQPQAARVWPDAQFEQYVFQQDQSVDRARKRFESLLTTRVEEIERTCELTLTQLRKLSLMGRGDIKRFFDGYEKVKARFNGLNNDVNRLQEVMPEIAPLRLAIQAGPFHEDSLLCKSLRNILTDEQFAKYEALTQERRAFRHTANIELAVTMLEQAMPFRSAQRRELISILESETKPVRKAGQYDAYLILFQVSRLPDAKFKALLSDTQKGVLDRQLAQYAASIQSLRQSGLIADEDLAEAPTDRPK